MPTEAEIVSNWKEQHNILSDAYYAGTSGLTKEEFDSQHGAIWEMMESELIEAGYKQIPIPPRDLTAEIDGIKTRLVALEPKEM